MIDPETCPLFDGHMHFSQNYLDEIIASYDECGVRGGINLWGSAYGHFEVYTSDYAEFLRTCKARGLDRRFVNFYWPNWTIFGPEPERFVRDLCEDMRRFASLGCRGLKVWKDVGMYVFHRDGTPAVMDDERLEAVWKTASELNWTISVHMVDPSDGWSGNCKTGLSREEIFRRRDLVIERHPEITWILCHSANYIESVKRFGALLDRFPNVRADLSPLDKHDGREDIRAFLEKYAGRLYIGPDLGMPANRPPDRKWNWEEYYLPLRKYWAGFGVSDDALEKITWRNGWEHFLKDA
jgi:hypothetical protein